MGSETNLEPIPFFSIITINYNNAYGLSETLESVKKQTSKNYEHIIIDGGSSDESVSMIKKYLSDSGYAKQVVFWCSEKDNGIYDAMNKGLSHANGEYCLFLNSGDSLSSDTILEEILSFDFDEDLIYFNTNYVYKSKNKIENVKPPKQLTAMYLCFKGMINHQSMIIKTVLQKKYPFSLDYKIVSDRYFFLTVLLKENCSERYLNLTMCNYEAENGLSSTSEELMKKEATQLIEIFFPKRVQEAIALLDDYENGYKGILKKLRKVLFFVAKHTVRKT